VDMLRIMAACRSWNLHLVIGLWSMMYLVVPCVTKVRRDMFTSEKLLNELKAGGPIVDRSLWR